MGVYSTAAMAGTAGVDVLYNETDFDYQRGNTEGTALASAARTATTNSPDVVNYNARGVAVFLNVTVASGTGGLTATVQAKDPVSGNYININSNPTAVTATGLKMYVIYPAATGGGVTQATGEPLPRTWRVAVAHGDGTSYTYSVGYSLIV